MALLMDRLPLLLVLAIVVAVLLPLWLWHWWRDPYRAAVRVHRQLVRERTLHYLAAGMAPDNARAHAIVDLNRYAQDSVPQIRSVIHATGTQPAADVRRR